MVIEVIKETADKQEITQHPTFSLQELAYQGGLDGVRRTAAFIQGHRDTQQEWVKRMKRAPKQ